MSQSSTPIMDVMPRVIIPDMVLPLGPQFSKLPEELLTEIIMFTIGMDPAGMMIARRDKINLVCKTFFRLSNFVFYSCQIFNPSADLFRMPFTVPTNYLFPPVTFRNLIRRLKITIEVKDYFVNASGNNQFIRTVQEFCAHCAGARRLRELTQGTNGFCNLVVLEVVVLTDYNFPGCIQETLAVLRGATFGLDATRVYVLAVHSGGQSEQYHKDVVDAILGH